MSTAKPDLWYAHGDPWTLTQEGWQAERAPYFETLMTQSNGLMGVRAYPEENPGDPESCRESYLAGVFGEIDEAAQQQIRTPYPWPLFCMLSLPEFFACEIELAGERFLPDAENLLFYSRSLDLRQGLLSRHVVWSSPQGRVTRLHFDRFLSAADPRLAFHHISLVPENWSGDATLCFSLRTDTPSYFRCGDRSYPHLPQALIESPETTPTASGGLCLGFSTRGNGHRVCLALESDQPGQWSASLPDITQTVRLKLQAGTTAAVHRAVAVVCSRDEATGEPLDSAASALAQSALRTGYHQALRASEAVWQERWRVSDLELDGPARDQMYLRFAAFSQLQMGPFHSDRLSIPARAYAYNRYHGLYYWDSETFLLPQWLHTHPQVARNLLSFRHHTLDGARRTAQRLGSSGACYPWMTDADSGTEQAPWGIGDYVWHQNADIAYAINQYVLATGDRSLLLDCGLEILLETARFWVSRIEAGPDGHFHLHDTVGPDELDKHGRDNGYTSLLARHHLRLAASWLQRLETEAPERVQSLSARLRLAPSEPETWRKTADGLAVPCVPGRDIPLQDEFLLSKSPLSFEGLTADEAFALRHSHRVIKQADVLLAMFLLQEEFTPEQTAAAYDFYEPMTLHFSSLSYNTHAILAAQLGRDAQAYDYFLKAAGLDLDDLRGATRDGLHAAALGGTWQTVVYGFLGMRLHEDGIEFTPRLPETWNRLRLRIVYRGYVLHLDLRHEQHRVRLEGGEGPVTVTLNGTRRQVRSGDNLQS